jgi:hypothetical protein
MVVYGYIIPILGLFIPVVSICFLLKSFGILALKGIMRPISIILATAMFFLLLYDILLPFVSILQLFIKADAAFTHRTDIIADDYFFGIHVIFNNKFSLIYIISIIIATAFLFLAANILPKKNIHDSRFGKVKEPKYLKYCAYTCFIICFLCITYTVLHIISPDTYSWGFFDGYVTYAIPVGPVVMAGIYLLKYRTVYANQRDPGEYIGRNIDAVFLRSFYLDRLPFARTKTSNSQEFGSVVTPQQPIGKTPLSFESYFGFQITRQLGEFVCIGNPNHRQPKDGVITIFPQEREWKEVLSFLIENTRIIFMQIGNSKYIDYELNEIIASGNIKKLCILTQPLHSYDHENWKTKIGYWIRNCKRLKWSETKKILNQVGLKIDFLPEPGSVIIFNEFNEAVLIKKNCILPSEYVSAVRSYFITPVD